MRDSNAALKELSDLVYEGIWKNYNEPAYRRLVWTLSDSNAVLVGACFGMLLTLAGSRAWTIIRYVIAYETRPVAIGASIPNLKLSQGEAMKALLPVLKDTGNVLQIFIRKVLRLSVASQRATPSDGSNNVPPWFGIFAILNIAVFVSMGVAVPWFFTDGGLKAPVVKSKVTPSCLTSKKIDNLAPILSLALKIDAIFQQCLDQVGQGCESPYTFREPNIVKRRLKSCPFPSNICYNDTEPFEIAHFNITAAELGVNSQSTLKLNHLLTCSPVDLMSFQFFSLRPPHRAIITTQNYPVGEAQPDLLGNFSMILETLNGPNQVSNESSGLRRALERGPFDLSVLPQLWTGQDSFDKSGTQIIHRNLQRDDGMSFLIIHRAGSTRYGEPIEDRFFTAHNERDLENMKLYLADYEATGLACFEQYQYCALEDCTPWSSRSNYARTMERYYLQMQDEASFADVMLLFRILPSMLSVFDFLCEHIEWHNLVPLKRQMARPDMLGLIDAKEQWIDEVETWFMKSILHGILFARFGAEFPILELDSQYNNIDFKKKYALCGRILFRDGDYTNINWLGLLVTTASLTFICLLSLDMTRTHKVLTWLYEQITSIGRRAYLLWDTARRRLAASTVFAIVRAWFAAPQPSGTGGSELSDLAAQAAAEQGPNDQSSDDVDDPIP